MDNGPSLWRLLRDVALVGVAVFMLLHETLRNDPRLPILMVGLVLIAGPAVIRTVVTAWFGKGE